MLWEHHFRPIKMDHSQLYRRETITINISERMSEDMPDRMSEDMPDRIPEDMPDRMSEDMPDRMSDRMLEDLADRIPDRMSEDMPDKLYFHLHGSEMVYQILKPQILWEHHFRPIKMDHSQLNRGEAITINKDINDMC